MSVQEEGRRKLCSAFVRACVRARGTCRRGLGVRAPQRSVALESLKGFRRHSG